MVQFSIQFVIINFIRIFFCVGKLQIALHIQSIPGQLSQHHCVKRVCVGGHFRPHFSTFEPNNSEYRHFSRSAYQCLAFIEAVCETRSCGLYCIRPQDFFSFKTTVENMTFSSKILPRKQNLLTNHYKTF